MGKPSATHVSITYTKTKPMPRRQRKRNRKRTPTVTLKTAADIQKDQGKRKRHRFRKKIHRYTNETNGVQGDMNMQNNNINIPKQSSKSKISVHSLSKMNVIQAKSDVNKTRRKRNKRMNRVSKKFDKLIDNLQLSLATSATSLNSTAIEIDVSSNKRKKFGTGSDSPRKKSRQSISLTSIIINDDDDNGTGHCSKRNLEPPLHTSTPVKDFQFKNSLNNGNKGNSHNTNKKNIAVANKNNENCSNKFVTIDLLEDSNTVLNDDVVKLNCDVGESADSDCVFISQNNKTVIRNETQEKEVSDCVFVSEINKTLSKDTPNVVNENAGTDGVVVEELESGELVEKASPDCVFVSANNCDSVNNTDSDDSDVTIIPNSTNLQDRKIRSVVRGLAKLDASAKDRLLSLITQNIFSGCKKPVNYKNLTRKVPIDVSVQATEDDVFIKEVILGQTMSRNSVGSNIYNPAHVQKRTGLRMVVIDGSNVAMSHGQHRYFSVHGLKICIDYFTRRGHAVKAFVPRFRSKFGKSTNPRLLDFLEKQGLVVYTPSREVQGKHITPYDDRYIIQCAAEFDGVIVSGDNYRDLLHENPKWKYIIENRVLPFTFVDDMIMFPNDPLGRNGPSLRNLLRH